MNFENKPDNPIDPARFETPQVVFPPKTPAPPAFSGGCTSSIGGNKKKDDTKTPVFIGFDVEWTAHPKRKRENRVLAYGVTLLHGERMVRLMLKPKGDDRRHRLESTTIIGKVIQKALAQEVLTEWPETVILAVHFGRGDLAACRDFKAILPELSAVKGVLTTASKSLRFGLDEASAEPLEYLPRVPRSTRSRFIDSSGNERIFKVRIVDTYCLAPESASLDALGQLIGFSKLKPPEGYGPSDMARLMEERPADFERYVLRDAEITARYAQRIDKFCRRLGLSRMSGTLGGIAVASLRQTIKGAGLDLDGVFGLQTKTGMRYCEKTGRQRPFRTKVATFSASLLEKAAGLAYSGGRTETYITGPVAADMLRDIDLRSAYPSAMAAIGVLDYSGIEVVDNRALDRFTVDSPGFAEIEFDTPEGLRVPVFCVPSDHGLIPVRRGTIVATAPEIAAARSLGVSVEIKQGVLIPWDRTIRPYENFVVQMIQLRESLREGGKDTLESLTVKVITNSIYGKTAQGVRDQSVYDAANGNTKSLGPSPVSSPVLAAYTTGLVRAAIAELLNGIPAQHTTVSVSTDGFLSSTSVEEIDLSGPATQLLLEARRRISEKTGAAPLSDHAELLEVKKRVLEVVAFRNRGIATTAVVGNSTPVVAKNGIKVPKEVDANRFMLSSYLDREFDTQFERRDLIPLRAQLEQNADLVSELHTLRANFEPDMKRRLIGGADVAIKHGEFAGRTHLSTQSEPFDTVEDAMFERSAFDEWRKGQKRVMKTETDLLDWQDHLASKNARARSGAGIRVTAAGSVDVLKRQFLRALVRGMWGLSLGGQSHQAIADWLTASGYPTSLSAVKNATRKTLTAAEGCVAVTPASIALLRVLIARYPALDVDRLFSGVDAVEAHRQPADGEAA